jgi:hypothetical protein
MLYGQPLAQDIVSWSWDQKNERERKKKARFKKHVYVNTILPALQEVLEIEQ